MFTRADQLFQRLTKQLEDLKVPFVDDFSSAMKSTDQIVDAIFGMFTCRVEEKRVACVVSYMCKKWWALT